MSGGTVHARTGGDTWALADAGGNVRGNTYSGNDTERLMHSYEAIFGPAGRDIKIDPQRHKRHQRWHLPDNLKGRNEYLTDRIDGLITDATSSPFTRNILPYLYLESPDQKIKWNVYQFDEGMASRVPYESAARVLTQSKTSHAGYAVRQGLAIVMEHNFLASPAGIANFQNQLKQLVGSIQLTNDLDVHVALLQAVSYQRTIDEKYYSEHMSLYDTAKKYVDMFGIMHKIPNALDILIEDAKNHLKTWGSQPPTFLLCTSDLTAQLQMSPERTNYITNGPDGLKRLAEGPNLPSYRGLSIIHSQKFSLEPGKKPRNVLKRRVRVAEYYWIDLSSASSYQIYNQKKDSMVTFDRTHAAKASDLDRAVRDHNFKDEVWARYEKSYEHIIKSAENGYCLLIRPNIEHEMLTVIAGRGGTTELGATFWGQTELACYDDAQHGIWGMSYKYHERAIVTNERNLIRMFDVAFDGYTGGMDTDIAKLVDINTKMTNDTYCSSKRYQGNSIIALHFPRYLFVPTIENQLIKVLMQIFVPQLHDRGNDYDYGAVEAVDVSQCSSMLDQMHRCLTTTDALTNLVRYIEERDTLVVMHERIQELTAMGQNNRSPDEETELVSKRAAYQQRQPRNDGDRNIVNTWATAVVECISHLTAQYHKIRPNEARGELYARILQVLFKQFRGQQVATMGPVRAQQILTTLLSKIGDINSDTFKNAFQIVLEIMLKDFVIEHGRLDQGLQAQMLVQPPAAGGAAAAQAGGNGVAPAQAQALPPNFAHLPAADEAYWTGDQAKLLVTILCMLHGIEIFHTQDMANLLLWRYARNGTVVNFNDVGDLLLQHGNARAEQDRLNGVLSEQISKNCTKNSKHCKDLQYNLKLLQRPAFEVPNPLVLESVMRLSSNLNVVVGTDAEGASACDKDGLHNFRAAYGKHIEQDCNDFPDQVTEMMDVFDDFRRMYNNLCDNMWQDTGIVSASTYIQNNQTQLAAMAYHGNLTVDKKKGGREDVRCVGHLGNSFPGCACIREGKGMVNTYERMPTAVHVM
jgi:hypothetical protein